jgi:hypothetical protein
MDADFSIELGREDPVLDFPWSDPAGKLAYFDLKRQPELIASVEEAEKFPELTEFLKRVNSLRSLVESAKCDVWETTDLAAEEDIFGGSHKLACYVDLVFSDVESRRSLAIHESFARRLTELLRRAPEIAAAAEICVRRCFFAEAERAGEPNSDVRSQIAEVKPSLPSLLSEAKEELFGDLPCGFYFTVFVSGYGNDEHSARKSWAIAVDLVASAILQASVAAR